MPSEQAPPALLLIVPRAESEACRRLQQTLDGTGIRVVVDRRSTERRPLDARQPETRGGERRTHADRDAALAAGKWFIVPADAGQLDVLDADARAILFLYCSRHAVPCERCQETYRLGWLTRTNDALTCPRCGDDVTAVVVAHALRCRNWAHRRTPGSKPPARIDGQAPEAQTATG
jgi:hypothetical protein